MNRTIIILSFSLCTLVGQNSTWDVIQDSIWTPNCISCHDHGMYFAEQSGLILAEDVAYEELINVIPHNQFAAGDGLLLVGTDGIASIYNSFLWEKINAQDFEHFYEDHPEYGSIMPLGVDFLTNGQLEFIRQWIIAGVPDTGVVSDISLLEDTSRFTLPEFEALPPPETGLQLHLGPFEVEPQFERELFYFTELDTTDPVYVNKVEIAMAPGSHHFILYTYDDDLFNSGGSLPPTGVYRDIRNTDGSVNQSTLMYMLFQKFITGTQIRFFQYIFPEGIALKFYPEYGIEMNSHYVNYSDEIITGEVYTNIHTIDSTTVDHVADYLMLNVDDFELPPWDTTTVNEIFWFPDAGEQEMIIFQLQSHAHKKNISFKVYRRSEIDPDYRELIYLALDWEHPPIIDYNPPLIFSSFDGLELEATYYNDTDETTTFGLLSTDEMMILFGLYYIDEQLDAKYINELNPEVFSVEPNYPNPFNPVTTLRYELPENALVNITIYDIMGRQVSTLVSSQQTAGYKSVQWYATNDKGAPVSAGLYLYTIEAGQYRQTKKMVFLK